MDLFNNFQENISTIENSRLIKECINQHSKSGAIITENIFRYGSKNYFNLINEARKTLVTECDCLDDVSKEILSTDIGGFQEIDGVPVPLDLPVEQNSMPVFSDLIFKLNCILSYLGIQSEAEGMVLFGSSLLAVNNVRDVNDLDVCVDIELFNNIKGKLQGNPKAEITDAELKLVNISFILPEALPINPFDYSEFNQDIGLNVINLDGWYKMKQHDEDKSDLGFIFESEDKKVQLNKPKRNSGSGKKYMVYVKDPKTGNVKKVTFGDAKGGLTSKINNPEARKSFTARHDCKNKKDRTKSSYWSCNLPKYSSILGLSGGGSFYW